MNLFNPALMFPINIKIYRFQATSSSVWYKIWGKEEGAFYIRSRWPRGLRCRSTAARPLRLWVRIPPGDGCLSVVRVVCCQVEASATD